MVTGEAFFLDIAKIAITIAGFFGVVAALRHPHEKNWGPSDIGGFKLMLENSLGAVVAGLMPSGLSMYQTEPLSWLWCSFLLCVFLTYTMLIQVARILGSPSIAGVRPQFPRLLLVAFFPPTLIALLLNAWNAFSLREPWPYALGVFWLLFAAGFQFVLFLIRIKPQS
ncbi:MAG: hypothetical protein MN733_32830 [Nitrososphaera sp.]|nr:hypothetical protein [Nitrososphaera sp.]